MDQPCDSRRRTVTWRSILALFTVITLALMAVLPPLVNVNRFKRRIVTSISTSLGRPVHLDSVSLVLLPFPGFRLENFVLAEDPAFGSEPVIHANRVLATLRFSSLWRRRVEFSRISLQEPSINLVHTLDGRWNVESVLQQAARIPAAPTAQAGPSSAPRFPYIEATGARLNFKSGIEKLPFSLTEADFALWLPNPEQWRIRLRAKPTRTDTDASDTGSISVEATLGHGTRFNQIPLELAAEWKNAPLGEASRILTGRDAGLRGALRLNFSAKGTIGDSVVKSTIDLRQARRADFVPEHPLDLQAECEATSTETFHALHEIRCAWPPQSSSTNTMLIALSGDIPDIRNLGSGSYEIGTPGLPAATLLDWLRVATPRIPAGVTAAGILSGSLTGLTTPSATGNFDLKDAIVAGGPLGDAPVRIGELTVGLASPALAPNTLQPTRAKHRSLEPSVPAGTFVMAPTTIALGGKDPATLTGRFDSEGYTLHLTGNLLPSRLFALAAAVPQFGDGIRAVLPPSAEFITDAHPELAIHVDLTSSRFWHGAQTWSKIATPSAAQPSGRHHDGASSR